MDDIYLPERKIFSSGGNFDPLDPSRDFLSRIGSTKVCTFAFPLHAIGINANFSPGNRTSSNKHEKRSFMAPNATFTGKRRLEQFPGEEF